MGKYCYLYLKTCKRQIWRILILSLFFVITGMILLQYSALISTFVSYREPYRTLYYNKNIIECSPADYTNKDIDISEMKDRLESINGIRCYSRFSSPLQLKYKNIQFDYLMIEDEYWRDFSELPYGTGYSASGLSESGTVQAILSDPFNLVKGKNIEIEVGNVVINVEITARFKAPCIFPNLNYYGTGSALDMFGKDKTYLVFKKSNAVIQKFESLGISFSDTFTRFFFLEFESLNSETEKQITDILVENQYISTDMSKEALLALDSIQSGSEETLTLGVYLVFIVLLLSFSFLIIFYHSITGELTLLRLSGMKESQARWHSFRTALVPMLISFILNLWLFFFYQSTGSSPLPFLTLSIENKLIYNLPVYLAMYAAFAIIYMLISAIVLALMYKKNDLIVLVRGVKV